MRKFQRKRGNVSTRLSPYEVQLLSSLVTQLIELIAEDHPEDLNPPDETADIFDHLVNQLSTDPEEPQISTDPVLRRLFPPAYPNDAEAASDFRRFTERDLRSTKLAEARLVLACLADTESGTRDLRVQPTDLNPWLRTLTSVRIAVATRLGITDAESANQLSELEEDDPRAYMVSVYEWLGFAQETLIEAF